MTSKPPSSKGPTDQTSPRNTRRAFTKDRQYIPGVTKTDDVALRNKADAEVIERAAKAMVSYLLNRKHHETNADNVDAQTLNAEIEKLSASAQNLAQWLRSEVEQIEAETTSLHKVASEQEVQFHKLAAAFSRSSGVTK